MGFRVANSNSLSRLEKDRRQCRWDGLNDHLPRGCSRAGGRRHQ
ncbi:hypothetical protein PCH70_15660 [Pseudomonas cichorii JBC1]|nr:hypothetical protein PCH70_15660 [Pseudomonas cichorii JBC1]